MKPEAGQVWKHKGSGNVFKLLESINPEEVKYPSFKIEIVAGQYNWNWIQFGPGVMNQWERLA